MIATPGKAAAISWLLNYWQSRKKAERLALDYQSATELKYMLADLARFCNAFDSSLDETTNRTMANEGRREVWLHVQEMIGLTPEDLLNLKEETET